jgi:hypothetical protein
MSGLQEILLILIILLAILFIPRMTARNAGLAARHRQPPLRSAARSLPLRLSAGLRLAILTSVVWFCGALLYYRPWEGDWTRFGAVGGLPLVIGWGLYWVFAGHRHRGHSAARRRAGGGTQHPINKRR